MSVKTSTLAHIYEIQGHKQEAIVIYEEILRKNPNDKQARSSIVRLKTDHNFPLHGLFLLRLSITGRTAKMPVRFTLPGSRDPEQTGFAERFAE